MSTTVSQRARWRLPVSFLVRPTVQSQKILNLLSYKTKKTPQIFTLRYWNQWIFALFAWKMKIVSALLSFLDQPEKTHDPPPFLTPPPALNIFIQPLRRYMTLKDTLIKLFCLCRMYYAHICSNETSLWRGCTACERKPGCVRVHKLDTNGVLTSKWPFHSGPIIQSALSSNYICYYSHTNTSMTDK